MNSDTLTICVNEMTDIEEVIPIHTNDDYKINDKLTEQILTQDQGNFVRLI